MSIKSIFQKNLKVFVFILIILEITLIWIFSSLLLAEIGVIAYVNESNVTVITQLNVGNVYPEILNVTVNDGATISLIPNDTKHIECIAIVRDWNGDDDIRNATSQFFDNASSSYGAGDDNNNHYTNITCTINTSFGSWNTYTDDAYLALINCSYELWYYSNPGTWNCSIQVNDSYNWIGFGSDLETVSKLLALGLPPTINYGTVNATYVSKENITNVTNYGNVKINLSLSGYAFTEGDGFAMNCTLGTENISIEYEKFNLTSSNAPITGLAEFDNYYQNITSDVKVREFNLNYRQNDTENEATNETYWRIYVPAGVGGTCQGNIIFGAIQAPES
jgi:hypothetical protein